MSDFLQLTKERRKLIFSQTAVKTDLPSYAVEKDWWVTEIMRIVFSLPYAEAFVFKGGTSLSKGYDLIRRFSEDIDLAIDRAFLGMPGELSKTQIKKLRTKSSEFISTKLIEDLKVEVEKKELPITSIGIESYNASDTDPLRIYITYEPLTERNEYVSPRILLEISCRSLREPFEEVPISSLVDQQYPEATFANPAFPVRTVQPQRTFLEKVFLLHEEWQKEVVRVDRLSRHLYDLERLMDTEFVEKALDDKDLYFHIIEHRSKFSALKGVDYEKHQPSTICILPPDSVIDRYKDDYNEMKESMFSGEPLSWEKLIERLGELQEHIRALKW